MFFYAPVHKIWGLIMVMFAGFWIYMAWCGTNITINEWYLYFLHIFQSICRLPCLICESSSMDSLCCFTEKISLLACLNQTGQDRTWI